MCGVRSGKNAQVGQDVEDRGLRFDSLLALLGRLRLAAAATAAAPDARLLDELGALRARTSQSVSAYRLGGG
jgi:hypothetical protein